MTVDAVHPDPHASYEQARAAEPADAHTTAVVSAQIGRPARGSPAVVHRCVHDLPTVVRVDPRLDDGTPFPTSFWLTCPLLRSRVGTLEADHAMVGLNERLDSDPDLARDYAASHDRYVAFRDTLGEPLPGAPGSGGMPRHIKCLHVHAAHHLATGDNPIGAWVIDHALPMACPAPCVDDPDDADGSDDPDGDAS
ncbi:MAG: DUF501 domain-containing protein [Nitriliruptoraceae bacterium]